MVERERGEGGIELPLVSERLERRPPEDRADRCVRIDGDEVITVRRERPRELSAAAADLEHARRRGRQLSKRNGVEIHAAILECPLNHPPDRGRLYMSGRLEGWRRFPASPPHLPFRHVEYLDHVFTAGR